MGQAGEKYEKNMECAKTMKEERDLVKKAKRGDADAFAGLYEQIYKDLYHFALYTLKNAQDAEDAVSETVMDAFSSIRKLRSDTAFSAWIFRILSNKCNQKIREYCLLREKTVPEQAWESTPSDPWGNETEEYIEVRKSFFELAEEERMIVGMHIFLGYKTREIAEILNMNENTVRSKESRAIQKMGNRLKDLR